VLVTQNSYQVLRILTYWLPTFTIIFSFSLIALRNRPEPHYSSERKIFIHSASDYKTLMFSLWPDLIKERTFERSDPLWMALDLKHAVIPQHHHKFISHIYTLHLIYMVLAPFEMRHRLNKR